MAIQNHFQSACRNNAAAALISPTNGKKKYTNKANKANVNSHRSNFRGARFGRVSEVEIGLEFIQRDQFGLDTRGLRPTRIRRREGPPAIYQARMTCRYILV